MPSLAVLYDIHANLPALEAVVSEMRALNVRRVVFGGDVLPGPMPRETLEYLRRLDIAAEYIRGNGDREILERRRGAENSALPEAFRESMRWNARQLDADHERWINSWPASLQVDVPGLGDVLFCHATPRSDTEIFTRLTPEAAVAPMFDHVSAALVICGHTHMAFERRVGRLRVINPGSVGMPFGEPGAYWLLIGDEIEFRRTEYDREAAARRIRGTAYPQAEEFAARNILDPPTEAQMLDAYSR